MLTKMYSPEMAAIFVRHASFERMSITLLIRRGGKILIISTAIRDKVPMIKYRLYFLINTL
jgi:hypothetical protein